MDKFIEDSLDTPLKDVLMEMQIRIVRTTTYFGVKASKNPLDYWVYQEIIHEFKPDVIVEVGTNYGGSTLALAHICDLLNKGRIIGLDISQGKIPDKVRIPVNPATHSALNRPSIPVQTGHPVARL